MLTRLTIKNVVLIEALEITFRRGLVVFSGETGAGKSILLEALALALGRRAEARLVGNKNTFAKVSAEFEIKKGHPVSLYLKDKGIEVREELILRRELRNDGRSKAFINDIPVTVGLLSGVGSMLVEIHGQNEKIGLLDPSNHLSILDEFGNNSNIIEEVSKSYNSYLKIQVIYNEASSLIGQKKIKLGELKNSIEIINALDPKLNEEEELSKKRNIMMQSEKITNSINNVQTLLLGDNSHSFNLISKSAKDLENILSTVGDIDNIKNLSLALERISIEAKEAEIYLQKVISEIDFNPKELEKIEERLFSLRSVARRFSVKPQDLCKLKSEFEKELKELETSDSNLSIIKSKLKEAEINFKEKSETLSSYRLEWANDLINRVNNELSPLKLPAASFKVELMKKKFEDWNKKGADIVKFLVSMNKGLPEGELHKIASGGELSRLMLAINLVLAKSMYYSSLVFDEIDSGVSGSTADAVGARLFQLSNHQQVFIVTHLPQVASLGSQHLRVSKFDEDSGTITEVKYLDEVGRKEEIARMLSGENITEEARAAANMLIKRNIQI